MLHTLYRGTLALVALLITSSIVHAQIPTDRLMRDEPEVVLNAGGRYGTADVLQFTPDGKELLAAGDDKVVRQWNVRPTSLEALPNRTLRWPAWREQRGGIKSFALSPDATKVVVGGFGMRVSAIAVLDRVNGNLDAITWPEARKGKDNFNAVTAVAYHPDGKRIAFATADGSLFFWTPQKLAKAETDGRIWSAPHRVGRHERLNPMLGTSEFNLPRLIFFAGDSTLISVAQSGEVLSCDVNENNLKITLGDAPLAKPLFNITDGQPMRYAIRHAMRSADGRLIVTAAQGPSVTIRSMDGKQVQVLNLEKDQFARSIALNIKGDRLAVAVATAKPEAAGKPRYYMEENDSIVIYSNPMQANPTKTSLQHVGPAEAMAWHPTQARLAIAGGDADEITLVAVDLAKQPRSISRGAGRKIWGVTLSESGLAFGIQPERNADAVLPNDRAQGDALVFDLVKLRPAPQSKPKWAKHHSEADGWRVVPDINSRFIWHVHNEEGKQYPIPLERARDQAPTCFAFLPSINTGPTRLLVGHYYGASLFELRANGPVRTKLFTGHMGEVLSLAVAKDQEWFLSGGADQLVCAWSLKDWPDQSALGASFEAGPEAPVVSNVNIGSPGYDAGLTKGEQIRFIAVNGDVVFSRTKVGNVGSIDDALIALRNPKSGIELYMEIQAKAGAEVRRTLTTVRQRPLWKWFPAFNDENRLTDWVIWMWKGSYYYTPSANGDRLLGWHVNHPELDGKPEFYQLNQFENIYHKLEVVEELVNTRSVEKALQLVWDGNPQPIQFDKFEPAPVRLELQSTRVKPEGINLEVVVKKRGLNVDLLPDRVELWINDFRFKEWKPNGQSVQEKVLLNPDLFQAGENRVTVLSFNQAGGRAEDQQSVMNPRDVKVPQLLGVAVGVNDYGDHRKNVKGIRQGFDDLASAVKDAQIFAANVNKYTGDMQYYRGTGLGLKLDADATRKNVLQSLAQLAEKAKPDDHLMVFLAGHGDLLNKEGKPFEPKPGARGTQSTIGDFIFCCPDYSVKNPTETSIASSELFEALAKINCRKTVFVDACRSGRATDSNMIRKFVPNGQGPTIIAACDQSEFSYENPDPKLGHGIFTQAILDAMNKDFRKADSTPDGILTTSELFAYLSQRVPQMAKAITKGDVQTPICFPRVPPETIFVKK